MAVNILVVGTRLIREAVRRPPRRRPARGRARRDRHSAHQHAVGGVAFHGLQTRESGKDRFMSVVYLVPGLVRAAGADAVEDVEQDLRKRSRISK